MQRDWLHALWAPIKARLQTAVFERPFAFRKWPGWAVIVLGFGERAALYEERIREAFHIVRDMGAEPEAIVSALESPWFSAALVIAGVGYLIFVGEPREGVQRHPWWPYVGWSVFAFCLTAIVLVPTVGAIEIYLNREVNQRVSDFQRRAAPTFWSLTDGQKQILAAVLASIPEKERFPVQSMVLIGSTQSQAYGQEISNVFTANQWTMNGTMDTTLRPDLLGLHIVVPEGAKSDDDLSPNTKKLAEILFRAQIRFRFSQKPGFKKEQGAALAVGSGPEP